jgi:hypothetical protein
MVCTWRPLVEKFSIERYVREREEEMRQQQGGMTRAPSVILHHWWLGEVL